ncbi:hypothetical protein [Microbacterium sp. Ru50]|uniref:hypothetical protein n=1 Tax=Microbacterium sp. Ru50 TaxID=2080744 RepID=UPI0011AFC873|nr:hypothetical protein [Microbacterium sp. Ru50]
MITDDHAARKSQPNALPRYSKRKFFSVKRSALILAVAAGTSLVVAPVAHAASITYAHNAALSQGEYRYSGLRNAMTGGQTQLELFSGDGAHPIASVETYRPAPGYQTIGYSEGGLTARLSHGRAESVHQKCSWVWPWTSHDIGKLRTTCTFYY